ncbi:MAG: Transciptional regulator containing HTH domain [Candidatus Methanohalarchaeum thermophilum]|uniref:Transciptional regulator containing HTH domain n=1 Tax=Methanohalarchaeum thermophilum TaxID=1903181 RepID=A0A1Q6DSU4_METT1|nr:MAG: Transciptional regulator containing HTH domain [Candidatus Methanohalarchaeum thermophilum]
MVFLFWFVGWLGYFLVFSVISLVFDSVFIYVMVFSGSHLEDDSGMSRVERLRREADTIFCRLEEVEERLEEARHREGSHWEDNTLEISLGSVDGDEIDLSLDLDLSAVENAQKRYDKANEVEEKLKKKEKVKGELVDAPSDPVSILVLAHLKKAKGDYPKNIALTLNQDIGVKRCRRCCQALKENGLLEKIPSGMLKRKNVKLKRSLETHQHHTYYTLSDTGSHLLRKLGQKETKKSYLYKYPESRKIAKKLKQKPHNPRKLQNKLKTNKKTIKIHLKAMNIAGLIKTNKPKNHDTNQQTTYKTTEQTNKILKKIT